MVLDTSAIVAAIAAEANSFRFRSAMLEAPSLAISAVTVLEYRIVLQSRYGSTAVAEFDAMLAGAAIAIEPFDAAMSQEAFDAFRRYGKGQGHPAQLNILDCAAYALAKIRGEPLLFKGDDFARTDIQTAF
jgi:ribonuclease VapC